MAKLRFGAFVEVIDLNDVINPSGVGLLDFCIGGCNGNRCNFIGVFLVRDLKTRSEIMFWTVWNRFFGMRFLFSY